MNEANGIQIKQRIDQVAEWLIDGMSRKLIVQNGAKNWNLAERQIDKYIRLAKNKIKNDENKDRVNYKRAWHVRARMNLYNQARQDHETKLSLDVLDSLAKFEGFYEERLTITDNSTERLLELLEEIDPESELSKIDEPDITEND